jgi:hypothetical protein
MSDAAVSRPLLPPAPATAVAGRPVREVWENELGGPWPAAGPPPRKRYPIAG